MPDTHARFSPSAANRRIHCPPSLLLEEQFEEGESVYAAEGTAGHALAEHLIRKYLKQRTTRPTSEYYKDELLEAVDEYVSFVIGEIEDARRECHSPVLLVEQRIDASEYVDGCFGTSDMVIITDKVAHVIDLKLGKGVEVHAEENPQLMYSSRRPWNPMIARVSLQIISIRFCRRIGMDLYQRRSFLGESEFGDAQRKGTVCREKVCVMEIWCECFGKERQNLKRTDSYEIEGILHRIGCWERMTATKTGKTHFPLYGPQKTFVRHSPKT